jgi:hypothetical protein
MTQRYKLERLLIAASDRQKRLEVREAITQDKLGVLKRDAFLALVSFLIPLGWAISGLPQNILVACGFWIAASVFVIHAVLSFKGIALWGRWTFVIIGATLAVYLGWKPVRDEYLKEYQDIYKDIEVTWMSDRNNNEYIALPAIPPSGNDKDYYFQLLVVLPDNKHLEVSRTRNEFDRYVRVFGRVNPDEQKLKMLESFSVLEKERLNAELRLALNRDGNSGKIEWTPRFGVVVVRGLPIKPYIARDVFLSALRAMDSSVEAAEVTISKAIDAHFTNPLKLPSDTVQ